MKSNIEWKKWGQVDPLYAVATWPGKQKGSEKPWTDDEFYALGASDWQDFHSKWQSFGYEKKQVATVQAQAIKDLPIEKIVIWDGGGESSGLAGLGKRLMGSLPPMHELAKQVGLDLPDYLGSMQADKPDAATPAPKKPKPKPAPEAESEE